MVWHHHSCFMINLKEIVLHIIQTRKYQKPVVIGISGDGALGKTYFANCIEQQIDGICSIQTDGYIKNRSERKNLGIINGDDPRVINFQEIIGIINDLSHPNKKVEICGYNHKMGVTFIEKIIESNKVSAIIVDGISSIYKELIGLINYLILIDADTETRKYLRRSVEIAERGYSIQEFKTNWKNYQIIYNKYITSNRHLANLLLMTNKDRQISSESIIKCYCNRKA